MTTQSAPWSQSCSFKIVPDMIFPDGTVHRGQPYQTAADSLLAMRRNVWERLRKLLEDAQEAGRGLNRAEEIRWDELNRLLLDLDSQLRMMTKR